jgi:hypothetical protein
MGLLELLRRSALMVCTGVGLWLYFWTPEVLLEVRRADFAREYQRKFGKRDYPMMGAMELGRELIRKYAHPGSLENFTRGQLEGKSLAPGGPEWAALYRELPAGGAFFSPAAAPFTVIRDAVEQQYRRSQYLVMYMPVKDAAGAGHLEIRYQNRPRESKAPAALKYPFRGKAWIWLAGGLLCYVALPWRRQKAGNIVYGRTATLVLDAAGALYSGFFFALPLAVLNSTAEAMGEEFGLTVFCWLAAGLLSLFLLWASRLASYCVRTEPAGLRVEGLLGSRSLPFHEMEATGYVTHNQVQTGIFVRMRGGRVVKFDWSGLLRFEGLLQALAVAQVAKARDFPT